MSFRMALILFFLNIFMLSAFANHDRHVIPDSRGNYVVFKGGNNEDIQYKIIYLQKQSDSRSMLVAFDPENDKDKNSLDSNFQFMTLTLNSEAELDLLIGYLERNHGVSLKTSFYAFKYDLSAIASDVQILEHGEVNSLDKFLQLLK